MYILGINAYHGDASASLLKNGVVIAASEEERFRRIKHWAGFPSEAIKFCLKDAGITIDKIDYITISRDPRKNLFKKFLYIIRHLITYSFIINRIKNFRKIISLRQQIADCLDVKESDIRAVIYNIEHHRSHLASSFFPSRFKESAILSVDGFGDFTSTMTALGKEKRIKVLDSIKYPHSLGLFYTAATQFLGFPNYGDEYKIMGLAPYGKPVYVKQLREIIKKESFGRFKLINGYFSHFSNGVNMQWENGKPLVNTLYTSKWEDLFGNARNPLEEELKEKHINFAASVQKITEEIIFHILNYLYDSTNTENICMTGGVAQNSVINGKILKNTPFKNIYISAASHDAGTSIGSSLFLYHHILGNSRLSEVTHSFFGEKFREKDITDLLDKRSIDYVCFSEDELFSRVAKKIEEGGVIGWFQGRAEFGPRALGNRSIIVDPRRKDAKDLLNDKIKRRENFRPFAPSILREYVKDYFVEEDNVPFMEKVFHIKESKHAIVPAVTHVDGTGRLQTVTKKDSPKYYRLISSFAKLTGVPILLNTSFNENEPIVNTPEEALDCFLRTKMDMLVMENIIIER